MRGVPPYMRDVPPYMRDVPPCMRGRAALDEAQARVRCQQVDVGDRRERGPAPLKQWSL